MPGLLLLVAADVLIRAPSHALAWRLLHDPELLAAPGWLASWLPAGAPFDRDPLALLLAGGATGLAAAYLAACLARAGAGVRAALLGAAVALLVLLPSVLHMSVGFVTGRPFGQDGGVVQLPLALDRILAGETPYGADYSDSMLGKQSRASAFWRAYGGNPIVRHHAYLPGTHLLMLPPYLAARVGGLPFDARAVSLLAFVAAALLAAGFFADPERRLSAAAAVALNPLVYWQQSFGANDMLFVAILLGAARLLAAGRSVPAGALLGLACATKQLAWPFAPFLLLHASGARDLRGLLSAESRARLRGPVLAAALVFLGVVAPLAALDPRAFWSDIVAYNLGLGEDRYPLGGTPGIGLANFVVATGGVRSLRDASPLGGLALLLVPLTLLLARAQLRRGGAGAALAAGSVALLATVYLSRIPHASYLIAVAALLPVGVLLGAARADAAVVPLLLLAYAATVAERGVFRLLWQDALEARIVSRVGTALSDDPLGLVAAAAAAGLALAFAAAHAAGTRLRLALCTVAALVLVAGPPLLATAIGRKAGVVRAQEPALVPARSAREAWPTSFRLEPPARLEDRPETSSAAALTARVSRIAGIEDARPAGLLCLGVALALWARRLAPPRRPLAVALALLPPAALGILAGSLVGLWWAGLALLMSAASRVSPNAALGRAAAALFGVAAWVDVTGLGLWRAADLAAGVGLVNLAAYAGRHAEFWVQVVAALGRAAAAAVAVWTWRRAGSFAEALLGAALAWTLALFFANGASPMSLAIPAALAALAALLERETSAPEGA